MGEWWDENDTEGWIDLGEQHWVRFSHWSPDRELNPQYDGLPDVPHWGLTVRHMTPDGRQCMGGVTFDGEVQRRLAGGHPRWNVISLEPETLEISPSLLCHCGDHGFIRAGRWVRA